MSGGLIAGGYKTRQAKRALDLTLLIPVLLFVCFFVLYSATRTRFNTFDAVSYANQVERLYPRTHDPSWLFHPHHLLFNISGYAVRNLLRLFGWHGSVLETFEAINAAFAAFGIAIFFIFLRRKTGSIAIPIASALMLGVTYGYWVAATDGRVNVISAVMLLVSFSLLSPPVRRSYFTAGIVAALGILYHESAVLFVPVGAILSFLAVEADTETDIKGRVRNAAIFVVTCLAVVIAAYLIVGIAVLGLHSPHAFRHWATQYAELGWWWDFHILRNLSLDNQALLHAIVVHSRANAIPSSPEWMYRASEIGCVIAGICLIISTFLLWWKDRALVAGCWLWMLIYAAFFTVWSPGYFIFWIPVVLAATTLTFNGLGTAASSSLLRGFICAMIVAWGLCIGVQNASEGIVPHLEPGGSPFQRVALDIKEHTDPDDIVILTGEGDLAECEVNIPYFGDREAISLHTMLARHHDDPRETEAAVQAQIDTAMRSGHGVYVLAEAHDPAGASTLLIARHPAATIAFIRDLYAPWTSQISWKSDHGPVWKLAERPVHKAEVSRRVKHHRH